MMILWSCLCSCLRYVMCITYAYYFSHDMIAMIYSSVLHLCSTSLHDLITMFACLVAPPMIHTCSFHAVDDNHLHALHMIIIASCHISPYVGSLMLDALPSIECNNDFNIANEIAPIAFSHIFGDFAIFLVKHACLTSLHHIPSAMNIAIVASYYSALVLLMVMCKRREPS